VPCVWNGRRIGRCQTPKSLARSVFSFARFWILWGNFFGAVWWLGLCALYPAFVQILFLNATCAVWKWICALLNSGKIMSGHVSAVSWQNKV
jgi:hypothetical protein